MSSEQIAPRVSKWPFFLGDAVLLGCAWFIYHQASRPLLSWEVCALAACAVAGAWLAVWPFRLEYQCVVKAAEARELAGTVEQIQNLERIADKISGATGQWQGVQDSATKTVSVAGEIAARMAAEGKNFTEFLQKANDSERAKLRLEVEKLRRAEGDWLQVLVRILDHVLALHGAAVRSGQPGVVKQLTQFRDTCLDTTRRLGLVPFGVAPGQPFDAQAHQRLDDKLELKPDAKVAETLAPGYTYQGQPIRRAVVRLEGEPMPQLPPGQPAEPPKREGQGDLAMATQPSN